MRWYGTVEIYVPGDCFCPCSEQLVSLLQLVRWIVNWFTVLTLLVWCKPYGVKFNHLTWFHLNRHSWIEFPKWNVCQMLMPSCFEGRTRPEYATETTCWTVSQKQLAHCPPGEHKNCSTVSNCDQVSWKLCGLEGAESGNLQIKIEKMYPAFIYLLKSMPNDGSLRQHEKM